MIKSIKGLLAVLVSVFSATGFVQQTSAQETAQAEGVLEEILVTASRREESLQEVGMAVIAVDPAQYNDIGLDSIGDLIDYTPGLNFTSSGEICWGLAGSGCAVIPSPCR